MAGRKQPSHEANTAWKTAAFLGQVNGNGLGSWWAGSLQDSRTAKGGMLSDRELLLGEGNEKVSVDMLRLRLLLHTWLVVF